MADKDEEALRRRKERFKDSLDTPVRLDKAAWPTGRGSVASELRTTDKWPIPCSTPAWGNKSSSAEKKDKVWYKDG